VVQRKHYQLRANMAKRGREREEERGREEEREGETTVFTCTSVQNASSSRRLRRRTPAMKAMPWQYPTWERRERDREGKGGRGEGRGDVW
jgi:hypothetical protein